jgi:hypothetical protein
MASDDDAIVMVSHQTVSSVAVVKKPFDSAGIPTRPAMREASMRRRLGLP